MKITGARSDASLWGCNSLNLKSCKDLDIIDIGFKFSANIFNLRRIFFLRNYSKY